jgi:hypothetical protein
MADLNSVEINGLSEMDLGVWLTPTDQIFVDGKRFFTCMHSSGLLIYG